MARASFLDRVQPNRARSKVIDWPFPFEGAERPKVRVRVLGAHELEAAHLATADYFKALKLKVESTSGVFVAREHVELVWLAFADEEGGPLLESAALLAKEAAEVLQGLYQEWSAYQADVTAPPLSQKDMDALVEGLKKNTLGVLLHALPSSWLIELATTLASQLPTSTSASEPGL